LGATALAAGLLLAPSAVALAASADTDSVYVVTSADGGGGGGAGCSAEFCLLRDAVQAAEASPGGDTIRFAPILTAAGSRCPPPWICVRRCASTVSAGT